METRPRDMHPHPHETKDAIITRKIHGVLYDIMVKTSANMVYVSNGLTLTELLANLGDYLTKEHETIQETVTLVDGILEDAPETMRSFQDVWNYINVNGDPKSELIRLIESKQSAEEGKGLSTHDLTDILYEKLVNDYTKEELNARFEIISRNEGELSARIRDLETKNNIQTYESGVEPVDVKDGDIWFEIVR